MKEENFPRTFLVSYSLRDRVRGELQNLRGKHSESGALKAKQRKFTTEITPNGTSQLRSGHILTVALESGRWVQRLGFQGSDFRKRTGVDCSEDILRGYIQFS